MGKDESGSLMAVTGLQSTLDAAVAMRARELVGLEPLRAELQVSGARDDLLGLAAAKWSRQGMRATSFVAPISALYTGLEGGRPVVTLGAGGQPAFLVSGKGGRFCVESADGERRCWMTPRQLAEHLGLRSAHVEGSWLALDGPKATGVPLLPKGSPWKSALALLQGEQGSIWAIALYATGIGLFSLILPLTVQALVNTVAFGQLIQPLAVLTLGLGAGLAVVGGLRAMQAWMVEVLQRRLLVRLVSQLVDRLPRMQSGVFERGDGPELMNRFFDIFIAQKSLASLLLGGIEAILIVVMGLLVLALYHPALLSYGMVLLLAFVVVFSVLGIGGTKTTIAESKSKYALAAALQEFSKHHVLLKSPSGRRFARSRLDQLASSWLRDRSRHYRVYFRQLLGGFVAQAVAHAGLLGLGGWLVMERTLTLGQLVAAELIVTGVIASLAKLVAKLESVYDLVASADKLSLLLALPVEEGRGADPVNASDGTLILQFREVTLEKRNLVDQDLAVRRGEVTGVKGSAAALRGLSDILCGFVLPDNGVVYVNEQDVRDIDLNELRGFVAVVRDAEILPGTVADNLSGLVNKPVSASRLWDALALVGLTETIRSLPDGVRTVLSPSGKPLERADLLKLTLARAAFNEPSILVLDGLLDCIPETERAALLAPIGAKRTVVVLTREDRVLELCEAQIRLEASVEGVGA